MPSAQAPAKPWSSDRRLNSGICVIRLLPRLHGTVPNSTEQRGRFDNRWNGIVEREHRELKRPPQRCEVVSWRKSSAAHCTERGGYIRCHANPIDSRLRTLFRERLAPHQFPTEVRKVNARAMT